MLKPIAPLALLLALSTSGCVVHHYPNARRASYCDRNPDDCFVERRQRRPRVRAAGQAGVVVRVGR